jgi:hypothetical protein
MAASRSFPARARRLVSLATTSVTRLLRTIAYWDESEGALGRHGMMLASLIVLLVALPLGHFVAGAGGPPQFPVLLALVLMAAVFVNSHQRWLFVIALAFGIVSIVGIAWAEITGVVWVRIAAEGTALSLLGFTTLVMFNSLVQTDHVSQDTVVGGVCVFLMIGLCFTMVYILLAEFVPASFVESAEFVVRRPGDSSEHATTLLYFSFVTLTTLGYGDVAPRGDMARMFSVGEALIGQLYLVVFLARLVALYLRRARGFVR